IQTFEQAGVSAVIVNAAGCGAKLKEYGNLLAHDPEFSSRARSFSQMVVDISEFLDGLPALSPPGRLELKIAYDDPCHLLHAQRIGQAPRRLLQNIPGLKLLELRYPDQCCGSAGIYNITHSELSTRILERKVEDIKQCGPAVVATGNPGCILQIAYGLRMAHLHHIQVMHPMEILDRAYGSTSEGNGRNTG
ncbi:MAG: heterodisulfide reductase-related iron-sulfur binding cluster, partial [Acidobacteriota bacterium]|nr:heterodisulfide reductase-related iron-sulfur binding cluster [Acidobacteriota bacterium]